MPRRVIVPSRVNIIGEHTDYAGGLALPFATETYLELTITRLDGGFVGEQKVIEMWQAVGGYPAELTVRSNIPIGKGMSSSAALCVAIAVGINPTGDKLAICKQAQRIEHQVLGKECGLLDQMAMVFAKQNYATLINFSNHAIDYIPIDESWIFKLVDSGIHSNLSEIDYQANTDYSTEHINSENRRVKTAINAKAEVLGKLLNESHDSLKQLGVSLTEIDQLIRTLQSTKGVLGARMMGGGYGGMILVLVENQDILPNAISVSSSGPFSFEEFA